MQSVGNLQDGAAIGYAEPRFLSPATGSLTVTGTNSTLTMQGAAIGGFYPGAAGNMFVQAGGYVSDMAGGHGMLASGDVLAANSHLHLPLAALIKEAMRAGRAAS